MAEKINKEEDKDNLVLPKKYLEERLFEVDEKFFETPVLYMFRLWNRFHNVYFYKSGFTENIQERIKSLNSEFDCCGRIVLVMVARNARLRDEKKLHKLLGEYRIDMEIKSKKHTECYHITTEVYDMVNEFMEELDDNFFDTKYYSLVKNKKTDELEEELCWGDKDDEEVEQKVILKQDNNEAKFWHDEIDKSRE
jgi:hypothetical protein